MYLLDFQADNLPDLKKVLQEKYPEVKVTITQADAADEDAISKVCKQALDEGGRLDVFFANVPYEIACHHFRLITMNIVGRSCYHRTLKRPGKGTVHGNNESQCFVVCPYGIILVRFSFLPVYSLR